MSSASLVSTSSVCFIACHGRPAEDFSVFAEALRLEGRDVYIIASGQAKKKFDDRQIKVGKSFVLDATTDEGALAQEIAEIASTALIVITDLGHLFAVKIHLAIEQLPINIFHYSYYDNYNKHVPVYSEVADKVMKASSGVIFANANIKSSIFEGILNYGIGYYPMHQAEALVKMRSANDNILRSRLFKDNGWEDKGEKILVYFGGNNEEYFNHAFPAFLKSIGGMAQTHFSQLVILFQQHPGAAQEDKDRLQVTEWEKEHGWVNEAGETINAPKIAFSIFKPEEALVVADGFLYHQTSMAPLAPLVGIPTLQIGDKPYDDLLVANKICRTAQNSEELIRFVDGLNEHKSKGLDKHSYNLITEALGYNPKWTLNPLIVFAEANRHRDKKEYNAEVLKAKEIKKQETPPANKPKAGIPKNDRSTSPYFGCLVGGGGAVVVAIALAFFIHRASSHQTEG